MSDEYKKNMFNARGLKFRKINKNPSSNFSAVRMNNYDLINEVCFADQMIFTQVQGESKKKDNLQFAKFFWGLGSEDLKKLFIPKLIPIFQKRICEG